MATKTDLVTNEALGEHLLAIQALGQETGTEWAEIVPVSAKNGDQVGLLTDLLVDQMPEGPQLYPDGELTDAPEETIVAELIREAALEGVHDELPHSIAVVVEEMALREGRPADKPLLDIHASLFVERDSQKGIVIGHKGSRLSEVGTAAREQIQAMLGTPVYLDLHVKIAKDWQRDPDSCASSVSSSADRRLFVARSTPRGGALVGARRLERPGGRTTIDQNPPVGALPDRCHGRVVTRGLRVRRSGLRCWAHDNNLSLGDTPCRPGRCFRRHPTDSGQPSHALGGARLHTPSAHSSSLSP